MSFAKAAEELFVTPAALSYQIKNLETELGLPLFRRLNRQVELTEAGRLLAPGMSQAFETMKSTVRAVARLADDGGLTLTAGPAFTAKWLAPRLFRFVEQHPEIDMRLIPSLKKMDFDRDEVDCAIRFTRADEEPGCYVETLVHEVMTPVCTPRIAAELKTPQDLIGRPLIHDDSMKLMSNPPNWGHWLKAAGVDMDWNRGMRVPNADHSLDAASEGGGVALGRLALAASDLRTGRLAAPFKLAIDTGAHFNFVCPEGMETRPAFAALLDWLRAELIDESAAVDDFEVVSVD